MQRIKAFLGYAIAVFTIFVVLATFIGNDLFGNLIVKATGITVSPLFTGGEVVRNIDHDDYQTEIHEAVFAGLLKPSDTGFVQVNWVKVEKIPERLVEDIDFDGDGAVDFSVEYDTKENQASIIPYNPNVIGLEDTYELKDAFAIRVILKNPN